MNRIFMFVMAAASLFLLSGCQTYYDASYKYSWDEQQNLARPKIMPGQKAYVWAGTNVLHALEETGLFSSVEEAPSRQPVPNGIYISMVTVDNKWESGSFLGALLTLGSLGLIPNYNGGETTQTVEIEVYQNGALLMKTEATILLTTMSGFTAPLIADEDKAYKKESKLLVRKMISELNRTTK
ncbi:hypothetical protein [Sideroxydans lithotrophicus]|uniref:DUF4136 domain-containing protein n=1 Tax=Sideroxydans lithotrophicus (strain ES-1) TaxID=580332 RepID=D5CU59_SIDLE|nr:hypothetical protein [Sideroxydans lithotrophicus]ADE10394.1 hypothetical protein Slit_0152 [Sideroxydans lithotrophicus ES-1]